MSRSSQAWRENFEKLKAYYKKYGNFYVPIGWRQDLHFALWVESIRKSPKHLPTELKNKLQKIGFPLNSSSDWHIMFYRLKAFYKKYGHSYVPLHQAKFENLFDWTVNQRRARSRLSSRQINALNSLEFDWSVSIQEELHWEEMYRQLVIFKKRHGHTKVPQECRENRALGRWVAFQRRSKTMKRLRAERVNRLNAIGFLWKEDIARMLDEAWEQKYRELVCYKKAKGNMDRITIRRENYELGLWMDSQIVRKEKLPANRKKKLNAIGFKWDKGDFHVYLVTPEQNTEGLNQKRKEKKTRADRY